MSSSTPSKATSPEKEQAVKPCLCLTSPLRDWWFSHSIRDELNKFKDNFVNKEWVQLYTNNEVKGTILFATSLVIATVAIVGGAVGGGVGWTIVKASRHQASIHRIEMALKDLKANGNGYHKNGTTQNGQKVNKGMPPENGKSGDGQ